MSGPVTYCALALRLHFCNVLFLYVTICIHTSITIPPWMFTIPTIDVLPLLLWMFYHSHHGCVTIPTLDVLPFLPWLCYHYYPGCLTIPIQDVLPLLPWMYYHPYPGCI